MNCHIQKWPNRDYKIRTQNKFPNLYKSFAKFLSQIQKISQKIIILNWGNFPLCEIHFMATLSRSIIFFIKMLQCFQRKVFFIYISFLNWSTKLCEKTWIGSKQINIGKSPKFQLRTFFKCCYFCVFTVDLDTYILRSTTNDKNCITPLWSHILLSALNHHAPSSNLISQAVHLKEQIQLFHRSHDFLVTTVDEPD